MAFIMTQEFPTVSLDITQISVVVDTDSLTSECEDWFFLWLMIKIHIPEHDTLMLTPEHDKLMLMHTQFFVLFLMCTQKDIKIMINN